MTTAKDLQTEFENELAQSQNAHVLDLMPKNGPRTLREAKVGDKLLIHSFNRSGALSLGTVAKVGRKLLHMDSGKWYALKFDKEDGSERSDYRHHLYTLEEWIDRKRLLFAKSRLYRDHRIEFGFGAWREISGAKLWRILEVMEEEDGPQEPSTSQT